VWYAPVQLVVLPIAPSQAEAADSLARDAIEAGLRAEVDHDGSIGNRIRTASQRRIPYVAVIGSREAPLGEVALRLRDGQQLPPMARAAAIALIARVAASRSHDLLAAD
jgi:threonyl-tRNA synthetase